MPRANLPPTPAPSGDIVGKDDTTSSVVDKSFNLPPPAMNQSRANASPSGPKPIQPAGAPNFSLPPPPTRSRTIIQMKPRPQPPEATEKRPTSSGSRGSSKKAAALPVNAAATAKKQPSATSAAGKKIARKTAHSVIERRRRSKMNEEFAVLKAMIPACTDQEMHKLAILQAGIDYLRYLENCVRELKAANQSLSTPPLHPQSQPPTRRRSSTSTPHSLSHKPTDGIELDDEDGVDAEEDDVAMEDAGSSTGMSMTTPAFSANAATPASAYTSPQSIALSPALDGHPRHSHRSSYTSLSTLPSPAFEAAAISGGLLQQNNPLTLDNEASYYQHSHPHLHSTDLGSRRPSSHRDSHSSSSRPTLPPSTSTSPTILPNPEQDREATAALLMLNQDRRGAAKNASTAAAVAAAAIAAVSATSGNTKSGRGKGMSVKDLLSC